MGIGDALFDKLEKQAEKRIGPVAERMDRLVPAIDELTEEIRLLRREMERCREKKARRSKE